MAVYDKSYKRTEEALSLDHEIVLALYPILEKAINNGFTPEDIFYIVSDTVQDWILSFVLTERNKIYMQEREG